VTVDVPTATGQPAVSPWIRRAAYAVPLCVLPSALWRLEVVVDGGPEHCPRTMGWIEPYYVASLSVVSLGAALLTIGLVRRWGEVVPQWLPLIGGRRVPVLAAVVPAVCGAVVLFGLVGYGLANMTVLDVNKPAEVPGCLPPQKESGGWLVILAYAPLIAWPPLLLLVTVAYYRRRTSSD
jgi:hypothetical protein